ncbi:MAG: hypothetical protein ACE5EQ_12310 [Phycisphaerae bacterium]
MSAKRENESSEPTTEQVEQALESFWRGSPQQFDRLIDGENGDESEPAICDLLHGVADCVSGWTSLPARIGDYPIIREIGHGGMAVVFEARQERTGRTVALKVIRR